MGEQTIVDKFLIELEQLFSKKEEELNTIESQENDYQAIKDLLDVLSASQMAFVEDFATKREEEKARILELLERIESSKERVQAIVEQIMNYYYLKESGLLEEEFIAPQRKQAEDVLRGLQNDLSSYQQQIHLSDISKKKQNIESYMEKLVLIGDAFTEGELDRPVEDIDFLEAFLNDCSLSDEEKSELLTKIWLENVSIYQEILNSNKTIEIEIEGEQVEAKEEIDERVKRKEKELSEEDKKRIKELLSDPVTLQKLVHIMDPKSLKEIDYTYMDPASIEEIQFLAEDEIETIIYDEGISPEQALARFFEQNDQREDRAKEILSNILDSSRKELLTREEQQLVMDKAKALVEKEKKQISRMNFSERQLLDNYISGLYRHKAARVTMYRTKSLNKEADTILRDAAYEANYFLNLIQSLDIDTEEDYEFASRACTRLQEIMDSYEVVAKDTKKDFIHPTETSEEEKGNLFFLMKNEERSFFEDDIQLGKDSKGISKAYYDGILNTLNQLEEQGPGKTNCARDSWKYLRSLGVKYKEGNRIGIFYVQTGKQDMIILGISFIYGREDNFREADMRVKMNEDKIRQMMDDLQVEEKRLAYEEKSVSIKNELQEASGKKGEEELEQMMRDIESQEISKMVAAQK